MSLHQVKIAGTGRYLPPRVVTNHDLAETLDTSDEWVRSRTGIVERRYADDDETTVTMAAKASRVAMDDAGLGVDAIDMVIVSTVTPDHRIPNCSALVQRELGLTNAGGFDVTVGCSGFVQAFQIAAQFVRTGAATNVIVIGSDKMTSIIDPEQRSTRVIFGDGAGAVIVSRCPEGESSDFLSMTHGLSGDDERLVIENGGCKTPITKENFDSRKHYVFMNGRAVFRFAVDKFTTQIVSCCEQAGISPADLKLVVPHQVNKRILDSAARRAEVSMDRVVVILDKYGNTSGGSVAIAFDEAVRAGRLERGDHCLFVSFGAGLAWAAALIRY